MCKIRSQVITAALIVLFGFVGTAGAQTLRGSKATMQRQNQAAVNYGYTFLQTSQGVRNFVDAGYLVRVSRTADMEIHNVSYPYARPEVKLFLERLSTQYKNSCGEKLTVTSLTRPISKQPANASTRSVHPTGMAVDLRIPYTRRCRSWLEKTLLSLEETGVLDVTRERNPPHYHVAVFTKTYQSYVDRLNSGYSEYVVRRGESLSLIAMRNKVSVTALRRANGLSTDMIRAGQVLKIPGASKSAAGAQVAAVSNISHKVRRGDTLWSIASLYGTSVSRIRSENQLASDILQIGQTIRLSLSGN